MPPAAQKGEQKQAIGVSRGGRSTKIHAIVDSKGRPLNFTVTGGQVHDSQVVGEVLDTPRSPLAVAADKAYDSEKVRQQIKDEGALPVFPSRSTATKKAYCPKRFYRRRHKIENYFCRIKDWRRIATRYDKLARNFLAAAALVGALYWIKLWVQTRDRGSHPNRQVCDRLHGALTTKGLLIFLQHKTTRLALRVIRDLSAIWSFAGKSRH